MVLAFLSDVHSNIHALDAVLADLDKRGGADGIYVLGDIVGYNAFPNEVIQRLRERNVTAIMGNHDAAATGAIDVSEFNDNAAAGVRYSQKKLLPPNFDWLRGLPAFRRWNGVLAMFHGSPRGALWEYVFPTASDKTIEEFAIEPTVVLGHTHYPMVRRTSRGILFNPGSVGQPRDGDPRASYAILDGSQVTHHRVAYDIDSAARGVLEAGLPPALAQRLFSGT